ncbi:MAG: hypothetical protein AB8I08_20505 [Sandaracinaceae bacterium]
MTHRTLQLAAPMVVSLLLVSSANAFYVESRGPMGAEVPVRFIDADDTTPAIDVEYRINLSSLPSGIDTTPIDAAMASWSSVDCGSLALTRGEDSASVDRAHWMSDAGARYVLVYFTDSAEEWTGGPAVGHYYFAHDGNGVLVGATVVLNTRDHAWAIDGSASAIDVQGTVTALLGRALGITSATEGNATFPRYAPGDLDKRALGADDRAALAFLYGDETCAAPMTPEDECDGFMSPGEAACPPRPETSPGDGGTATPDSGPAFGTDGGAPVPGSDAGAEPMPTEGGCTVSTRGSMGAGIAWIGVVALFMRRRRRA